MPGIKLFFVLYIKNVIIEIMNWQCLPTEILGERLRPK